MTTTTQNQTKAPLQLLPSALSTHREIWTHGLLTPPSGSPLYSEGDLSWDTVIERLQHKEKIREHEGSNLVVPRKLERANSTLEHDVQNRWLADLISGKLERSWRSNSNGALTTYRPVVPQQPQQQGHVPHYPLHSTSSTQQLSHHAFEFVPSQNKRYSAPVGVSFPSFADIGTPPQQKWRDLSSSPMDHSESMQKRRRRSHSGSPLSNISSTSSMSLGSQHDSSPPMRRKRRSVQCKFFLQGKCAKGEACPFSHASSHAASPSSRRNTKGRVACKYISSGKECPFGENCLFNHDVDQVPH